MNTLILGNGILGLSIAFRLIQKGSDNDRIVIIGKNSRPGSASLAAGAMLNSFAEIEAGSLDSEIDLYRFELSHLSTQMWPRFERDLINAGGSFLPDACSKCQGCAGGGCFDCGTYVVNNAAADSLDDENYDAILSALEDFNEPFELVSPRDIPNYRPNEKHRATRALYIKNEGWFNPRIIIDKLVAILSRHPRVTFIDDNVEALVGGPSSISGALLESGKTVSADKYVLATGASVTDILRKSEVKIPIQSIFYGVGVSVEIDSPSFPNTKCIRTPNRGLACGIYTVPYFVHPDKQLSHILLGATNYISPEPVFRSRISNVESIINAATNQINLNFYRADLVSVNLGLRPVSQDGYPLIGPVSSIKDLYIVSGTKRDGFHMAPFISETIASMILGEEIDGRISIFSPDRELIKSMTREEAINKSIKHLISAAYQHGFSPSSVKMVHQLEQSYRDDLERVHDAVGATDWGIPVDMVDMYRYGHAKA